MKNEIYNQNSWKSITTGILKNLSNHKLKGAMKGKRSIHVGFDLCIVFEVEGDYERVKLLDIGKYDDVYK